MNKKVLSWAVLFMLISEAHYGQSIDLFEDIDLSSVSNGLLLARSPGWVTAPNGSTYSELDFEKSGQLVFELKKSRLDSSLLPKLDQIEEVTRSIQEEFDAVPIVVTDIRCFDFVEGAVEDGLLGFENGKYVDLSGPDESILTMKRVVSCFHNREFYTNAIQRFVFPSSLQITNIETDTFEIQADFGNGQGWIDVGWDEVVEINYPNATEDRLIRIKLIRDGQMLKSGVQLRSGGGQTGTGDLSPAPWPTTNNAHPWRISVIEGEHLIKANAYVLLGQDGIFDKPFIFVEGVDFGKEVGSERNGTFGWYEFASGQSERYQFLAQTPELIAQLQEADYDIVLLDFLDGADYIQRNSAILQHLLSLVNEYKIGDEGNVVVGASMGGQVSRHALRTMEIEGTKHCCRLWISMDSPHKGAYIPAGIQGLIEKMAPYSQSAEMFIEEHLKRPAARQLLRYNKFADGVLHSGWYSLLDEIGFPQECRSIAISNGSLAGLPLDYLPTSKIINYSWGHVGNEIVGFDAYALPGSLIHEESDGSNVVVSEIRIPPPGICLDPACLAAEFFGLTINPKYSKVNQGSLLFYDTAPGGKYNTTEQFVRSLNLFLDQYWLPNIESGDYQRYHSFVSTASALAMSNSYTLSNIGQALADNPSLTPFDDFYAPAFGNQLHTQVTTENIDFVMLNVLEGEGLQLDVLDGTSPNNGVYNYCLEENDVIPTITIQEGGSIQVNANAPSHFAEFGDIVPEPGSIFTLKTAYCDSHIVIGEGGELILGSDDGNKGVLEIRDGSTLTVEEGGQLVIHAGSQLRVKSGAELSTNWGQLRIEDGGKLIIEDDAHFHWSGSEPLGLNGPEAVLDLFGDVFVHDGAVFSIVHPDELSGKIVVHREGTTFYGGAGAQIELVGDHNADKIMVVMPNARLKCEEGFGALKIQKGQIVLKENAIFENRNSGIFIDVHFLADTEAAVFLTKSATNISECLFENVQLVANMEDGWLKVDESRFSGDQSRVEVNGQGYLFSDCLFEDCRGFSSTNLSLSSTIRDCHFDFHDLSEHTAIEDDSEVSLFVSSCFIQRCGAGVIKTGGELFLSCTEISHCAGSGLFLGQDSKAYLNEVNNAGHNRIVRNRINIELAKPLELEMNGGFNTIRNGEDWNVKGFLQGECVNCASVTFDAHENNWSNSAYTPLNALAGGVALDEIDVWIFNIDCLFGTPSQLGCPVLFFDDSPVFNTECNRDNEQVSAEKKSLYDELEVKIYPNPSSTLFHVDAGVGTQNWQVQDASGRCVAKGRLIDGECDIQVSEWPKGVYHLSIESLTHKRLVVK